MAMMPLLFLLLVMLFGTLNGISSATTSSCNYFKARQLKPANFPNFKNDDEVVNNNNDDDTTSSWNFDEEEQHRKRILNLIRETYPNEYYNSTISHHFFLRMSPIELQTSIEHLIWNENILRGINIRSKNLPRHQHHSNTTATSWIIIPDVYHEIYLMRPEIDFIDDNKAHYDGILKTSNLQLLTLRSLTYLDGNPATFVAVTSMVNYTTDVGSTIIIDFNRELHYAILNNNDKHTRTSTSTTTIPPRVIIKAAVHVFEPNTSTVVMMSQIIVHRIVFFAVKSLRNVYESTEGSSSLLMILDNTIRTLNKVHSLLPLMAIGIPLVSILILGPIRYPLQILPYIIHVLLICFWRFSPFQIRFVRSIAICVAIARATLIQNSMIGGALDDNSSATCPIRMMIDSLFPKTIVLHLAWLGICHYMEMNAEMVRKILFAPIPNRIELDPM